MMTPTENLIKHPITLRDKVSTPTGNLDSWEEGFVAGVEDVLAYIDACIDAYTSETEQIRS